jgi:H+-transporting ATPase
MEKDLTAGIENAFDGSGLSDEEVLLRRKQYGYNEIKTREKGFVEGVLKRMWGPIPWILEAAMIFELILGNAVQAAIVFLLLAFSAVTGEIQEKEQKEL